jgi:hypothetical protein
MLACSTRSETKRCARSTGSWGSISMMSRSTGRCTRLPTEVKAPARTPLIVGSRAGGGRWRRNVTASRSAGRSTARTVTTSACSNPPLPRCAKPVCSLTLARCTSTVATTPAPCATVLAVRGSTSSRSSCEARAGRTVVTFAVGLFELFRVAIPGGLQLTLVAYLLGRLGFGRSRRASHGAVGAAGDRCRGGQLRAREYHGPAGRGHRHDGAWLAPNARRRSTRFPRQCS